eukprot:Seg1602.4 transcript_id=Seg1602.4/GoldUCD/mRNA.D3Y31 product="Microtubule-actin cross-linking factor 1 isoforms 1/2/3/5" protein_id=Seg1602.4/GoldUCD/D3Y31
MFDDRGPSFNTVQKIGKELIASQPDEESTAKTKEDLDKVTELWNLLDSEVNDRKDKVEEILPASQKFVENLAAAQKRVEDVDKMIDEEKWIPRSSEEDLKKQINDFEGIEEEVNKLEPMVEEAVLSAQALTSHCTPEDEDLIKRKLASLSKSHGKLKEKKDCKHATLKGTLELSKRFYAADKELNMFFIDAQEKLAEKASDGGEVAKVLALQKAVSDHKPVVGTLREMEQKLEKVVAAAEYPKINDTYVKDEAEYMRLKSMIEEEARSVVMAKEKVDEFNYKYDQLAHWLNDVIDRHRKLDAVAVDADVVKEQLKNHQNFLMEIAEHESQFKALCAESDLLLSASNEDEEPIIREKIDTLKHRQRHLNDVTSERQANLIEALVLAQQFSDMVKEVSNRISVTEDILKKINEEKSKGIDVQKEKIKDLQDGMDQLAPLMTALKETGNDLIRLSGPGSGSDHVAKKEQELEERWNSLSQRVQEKGNILKFKGRNTAIQQKQQQMVG